MAEDIFFKPPAHGCDWLGPQMVGKLLEFTQYRRDSFHETGIGNDAKGKGEIDLTKRRSWRVKELGGLRNEIQAQARALLPDMCGQLGTARIRAPRA
jgi:hypothetical protein